MKSRIVTIVAVGAVVIAWAGTAFAQATVATPAIDASVFKDGAVEDKNFKFGDWFAKCRQIVKIKKRVCNLLTNLTDEAGKIGGSVIIASTDTGIPAMMISLPREIGQGRPIFIDSSVSSKVGDKVVKTQFSDVIKVMVCDENCRYMFPLDSKLIFILNSGEGASVALPAPADVGKIGDRKLSKSASKTFLVSGRGFAQALTESTKEW